MKSVVLASVAALAMSVSAQAQTIKSQLVTSNIVAAAASDGAQFNDDDFMFQSFDTSLGSLVSVGITYSLSYSGAASVTFDPRAQMGTFYTVGINASGELGNVGDASYIFDSFSASKTGGPCGWSCVSPPPTETLAVSGEGTRTYSIRITDATQFAMFEGASPVVLEDELLAGAQNGAMSATGQLRVLYRYMPGTGGAPAAPEPSTWALMFAGVGLAGVALRSRKPVAAAV